VKKSVRDLLRHGKYKPTGRGKPACEYLLNAAREGRFPRINNLVDINNLVSLETQLPISLIDVGLAKSDRFRVRRGRAGEKYVFNSGGQEIDLEDLLLVSHLPADVPCANPVKDSMATKLIDASSDVLAVIYAPLSLKPLLSRATDRFASALDAWSGGKVAARGTIAD
jgi:DNA/RNA-binding domain of Phe-tRNA-synthetase-like protein